MPEPTSVILLGGSMVGMVFRLAKKCFQEMKRLFDIILSSIFLILLSPFLLIVIAVIKLTSSGPVIFSQVRVGKNGKLFTMYKFRSMNQYAEKDTGPVWAQNDDPRITPIGSFLRRTHIDEIPQFFNVIKGDMSIIGPRPERPHFVDKLKEELPDYQNRLQIRPGITGLAQVSHRYDQSIEDVQKKLHYDLQYINGLEKKSWRNEFSIILNTFTLMLTGKIIR